ncbi:Uncharacterized protein BWINRASL_03486 [Bacillus mycoides]|nr:Uncharacterized protein BWINRASL_03486 [Bacillus mycoides]
MALPPEKLQQLSMFVVDIYNAIEEELLLNMARMLKYDRELLLTAENFDQYQHWRIVQLNKLGKLNQQQMNTLARHSGKTAEEVRKMLEGAGFTAVEQHEALYQEAVQAGIFPAAPAIHTSTALIGILNTYEQQALDTLNLVNTTMLKQSQQVYLDILNKTVGKLLGGVITPQQALRQTVSEWAQRGIPALIDKIGRRWSTEAYVNMITRTVSQNVANEMQRTRMDEFGVDLIEVSSHIGARARCSPFQGRIYSKSGKSKRYPSFSSTSYGEAKGLLGVNCRHVIYPYIQGKSTKRYEPYDTTDNDKVYKESQQQRHLERQIRKAKKEVKVMEALGDTEGVKAAKTKVSQHQAAMREFIKETGRKRRQNREQIEPLSNNEKEQLNNFNNGLGNVNKEVKIPPSTLKHSGVGDFTNPKNPKKENIGNMRGGGHGQSNIELLKDHVIEYNIVEVLPNGVRLGNIPSHKEKPKKTGKEQSWFPESWTDQDINEAAVYVANLQDKNKYLLEETPYIIRKYANYNGVTVAIVYDKKRHSVTTIFPDGIQRLLGGG